jgi:hypothetical protein
MQWYPVSYHIIGTVKTEPYYVAAEAVLTLFFTVTQEARDTDDYSLTMNGVPLVNLHILLLGESTGL